MSRWAMVSLVLLACGGGSKHPREVSKIKYTSTSCEDNCGIAPKETPYRQPDEERDVRPEEEDPGKIASGKAPEPTCALVAETLVSLELGNYAEPEERTPKIAAEEKRCNAMRLSRDDRQCIVDSHDRTSIAYCVPALFPKEPQPVALTQQQCDAINKQMAANLDAQLRSQQVTDQRVWERQLMAAMDACRADRWNAQMGQCASYYVPMYTQNCAYVVPTGMWKRLEARLAKARGS